MSYDPTQQVPPPQGYPPQQNYPPQQAYPQSQPYTQQGYPQQPPAPATYAQYPSQPGAPAAGAGFNFNAFRAGLGLVGQIAGAAGVAVIIFAIFPWFSISAPGENDSWNGFASASGISEGGSSSSASYFPYVWLILLGALGLIAIAVMVSQRRLSSRAATLAIIATSGVMLLLEICFLIAASSLGHLISQFSSSASAGASVGFWLAAIATAAALGGAIYGMMQARKAANPYAAAPQYPGQQPPYPGY